MWARTAQVQVTTLGMLSKEDIKRAPLYKESEYKFVSFSSFHGSFFYDNEMPQAACAPLYGESQVLQVSTMLSSSSPPLWKHYTSKCTHRYPFLSSQIMAPCVMAGPVQGKALLLLGCPCGRGETRQINILGEDTWADLESSKIQPQETHFSQKGFQIRKKPNTLIPLLYHQQASCTHYTSLSVLTALLTTRMG